MLNAYNTGYLEIGVEPAGVTDDFGMGLCQPKLYHIFGKIT